MEFGNGFPVPASNPIIRPGSGEEYPPRCISAIRRVFLDKFAVMGVGHNTANEDLEAIFCLAQLATRSALFTNASEPIKIVEVGTWCGESAVMIGCGAMEVMRALEIVPDVPVEIELTVVDTFLGSPTDNNRSYMYGYGKSTEGICRDNLTQLEYQQVCPHVEFTVFIVEEESTVMAGSIDPQTGKPAMQDLDLVFLDAGHSEQELVADFEAWYPRVREGGYLAGHDYEVGFPGVVLGVDRLCRELGNCSPCVFPDTSVWFMKKESKAHALRKYPVEENQS